MLSDRLSLANKFGIGGLNPCSNGICSLTLVFCGVAEMAGGLNPCSNGICSLTCRFDNRWINIENVLILVLMEYAL